MIVRCQILEGNLHNGAIVVYTDNHAVRDCLISCNTSSVNTKPLLDLYLKIEVGSGFNASSSRVPTASDISDDPSRGDCSLLTSLGCVKVDVAVDLVWNDVLEYSEGGQRPSMQFPTFIEKNVLQREWSTERV